LPTVWASLDIRVITFRVVAVIPIAGRILLDSGRRLLNVDGRRRRYGDYGRRLIVRVVKRVAIKRIVIIRIRIKRRAEIKAKTGMAVVARPIDAAIQAAN